MSRYFTNAELLAIEIDATTMMLDHPDIDHWLGLAIDLSRELHRQQSQRERWE